MTNQNDSFGPADGPSSEDDSSNRRALLIEALCEEERILQSEMTSLRESGGRETHLITQVSETLHRMLYLTESLENDSEIPD